MRASKSLRIRWTVIRNPVPYDSLDFALQSVCADRCGMFDNLAGFGRNDRPAGNHWYITSSSLSEVSGIVDGRAMPTHLGFITSRRHGAFLAINIKARYGTFRYPEPHWEMEEFRCAKAKWQ